MKNPLECKQSKFIGNLGVAQEGSGEEARRLLPKHIVRYKEGDITRTLKCQNIKTLTRPYKKIKELMNSVKDPLGLQIPEVYQIPCTGSKVYV